ncbi:acid-soluble spore protein N [Bacillus sp. B190/17]|uniref:Small, acid-soluble spore protein N n=1 Tax=Bacillus lumedeiriae TaxID=3058829 RepID=A0ABW8I585_9BACI
MSKPKTGRNQFASNHAGSPPTAFDANKGKQMQDKSGKHPQVIQTKGE